jgi:hypothetical protein
VPLKGKVTGGSNGLRAMRRVSRGPFKSGKEIEVMSRMYDQPPSSLNEIKFKCEMERK